MTGWISDFLQRTGFSDGEALRLALCAMVVFSLVASWFFILASRHIASAMGSTAGASEARADASAGNGADCVAAT